MGNEEDGSVVPLLYGLVDLVDPFLLGGELFLPVHLVSDGRVLLTDGLHCTCLVAQQVRVQRSGEGLAHNLQVREGQSGWVGHLALGTHADGV